MEKERVMRLSNLEKGSAEYYKELCYAVDIELSSDTKRVFEEKYTQAVKEKDYVLLKSVFYHESKLELPLWSGGNDHSSRLLTLLELLACDAFDNIYRLLPEGLPLAANGYSMHVKATNLILCMLYNRDGKSVYDQAKVTEQAEKYIVSKQPAWDRAVVACVLAVLKHDVSGFSAELQKVCDGHGRRDIIKYKKLQCKCAYGLIVLAKHFWTEEEFADITYPEHKNFDRGYIDWFLSLDRLPDELCFTYEGDFEEMNRVLKSPVAITYIHQPYLGADNPYLSAKEKKAWYLDTTGKMLEEFCGEMAERCS